MRAAFFASALAALSSLAVAAPTETKDVVAREEAVGALYTGDGLYVLRTLAKRDGEAKEVPVEPLYIGDGLYVLRLLV